MTTFLFWNLNRKPLQATVARLASKFEVDVIVLLECIIQPHALLRSLNQTLVPRYRYAPGIGCKKVEILARFSRRFIRPVYETDRLTIRTLALPGLTELLVACVHFPSKLHWSEPSQAMECVKLAGSIRDAEEKAGHSRTILLGDLNMNPFEDGMVSASGLHGVMTRRIAEKGVRLVQGEEYPFFYNPMWGFFGDVTAGPPGTYYYRSSEHKVFFWNIFDQVLLRPGLLPYFDKRDIEILETDGNASLLSPNGSPDTNIASDHLPILLRLRL